MKVDPEWFTKLETKYKLNFDAFYKNIVDCNNGEPAKELSAQDGYPSCMFGLKVVKTHRREDKFTQDSVCYPDNEGIPEWLQENKVGGLLEYCHNICRQPALCPHDSPLRAA